MKRTTTIMGVETEYALAPRALDVTSDRQRVWDGLSAEVSSRTRAHALVESVARCCANMLAARAGLFLENGSRIYNDRGHVEYCTAEASDPLEACAQLLAGERLIERTLRDPGDARMTMGLELGLFNLNLDYGEGGSCAWGCHENYSSTGHAEDVRRALLPHLCSRVIYTGAGGFDPGAPLRFTLSPRTTLVPRIDRPISEWFFHQRETSYAGGNCQRLHLICGESLRSHRALYLKLATTALIAFMADNKLIVSPTFQPRSANLAIRAFAEDPALRATTTCRDGRERTALEIQFALLELAENAHAKGRLPQWAGDLIPLWRNTLTRLASKGRRGCEHELDWAIKWAVFDAHCMSRGISFEQLLSWNPILTHLQETSSAFAQALAHPALAKRMAVYELRRATEQHMAQQPAPRIEPIPWEQLSLVLKLRLQLRELDWRFCEVGGGIFEKLAAQGVLRHGVAGLTDQRIERAMTHAPCDTRARTRGRIVRLWHGTSRAAEARCDWDQILDPVGKRILYLSELQMAHSARWQPASASGDARLKRLDVAIAHYRRSHFASSARVLARLRLTMMLSDADATVERTILFRTYRYSGWVTARLGLTSALDYLRRIHLAGVDARTYLKVSDHLYCLRFLGLRPHPDMDQWIPLAKLLLESAPHHDEPMHSAVREHLGAWHLYRGELNEAETAIGQTSNEPALWRRVRIRCLLSDIERRRGYLERAEAHAISALVGTTPADRVLIAEQVTPMQAKLLKHPSERRVILDKAAEVLRDVRHRMALMRVLLLRARGGGGGTEMKALEAEVRCLRRRTPALRSCELMTQILQRWSEWVFDDETIDERGDVFWGL